MEVQPVRASVSPPGMDAQYIPNLARRAAKLVVELAGSGVVCSQVLPHQTFPRATRCHSTEQWRVAPLESLSSDYKSRVVFRALVKCGIGEA